ncbi:hypothetical protein BXZ70DRAFT_128927 [Cristinia sonorae]|uniref:Uncharacterized protein n=1 Tax=Cristinia sonorae TaxID=1940300 RepID=A0A8K0XQ62_9AGAR|nr:hypothetical protein BXZ70DRAFT_128927 [Cristinia sonorae]
MSFSYAPDIVIMKRKRQRRNALDPCLGYYMRSPSPVPVGRGQQHTLALSDDILPVKQSVGGEVDRSLLIPEDQEHAESTILSAVPIPVSTERNYSPIQDHMTVEAFLQWSAAATNPQEKTTRIPGCVDFGAAVDIAPSVECRQPLVRRYKRRRQPRGGNNSAPGVKKKGKVVRVSTRQTTDQSEESPARLPLQFSSQTPPRTPKPPRWRVVDPHIAAQSNLAHLAALRKEKEELSRKERRFSRWLPPPLTSCPPLVSIQTKTSAPPAIERPAFPRLQFVSLEEHEERMAEVVHSDSTVIPDLNIFFSSNDRHPFRTAAPNDLAATRHPAASVSSVPMLAINLDSTCSRPLGDPAPVPKTLNSSVHHPVWVLEHKLLNSGNVHSDTVSVHPSPLGANSKLLSQRRSITSVKAPTPFPAAPLPSVSLDQENKRLLKPIGSFMDEFKEIARTAVQMQSKTTDCPEPSCPEERMGDTDINPSSCARLQLYRKPPKSFARLRSESMLSKTSGSLPLDLGSSLLMNLKKPLRYSLSRLRPSSRLRQPSPPAQETSSPIDDLSVATHTVPLADIDILAALQPQTSQILLDSLPASEPTCFTTFQCFASSIEDSDIFA